MRMQNDGFLARVGCRFFAVGPLLPEEGREIALPIKPRDLPVGTTWIKVVNAAGKYVGGWNIDLSHHDPDLELDLRLLALRK